MRKVLLENMVEAWAFSISYCTRAAADNVESYLNNKWLSFLNSCNCPLPTSHRLEIDATPELSINDVSHHQSLIGVLRWMVELGRLDTCLEASMMSSCAELPRESHLEMLHKIFAHVKKCHNTKMGFNPSKQSINKSDFETKD